MDFTVSTYCELLDTLQRQGFSFQSFFEFLESSEKKIIVLRHDVDLLPKNSLEFAKIEAEQGIKGTYFFRTVPESFDENIIKVIHSLGHEIGYHYEDVSTAAQRHKGVKAQRQETGRATTDVRHPEKEFVEIAIESFKENLERFRKIVPVTTICMHGNPMSRWDSRLLWKYYDYHDFGIIGEPYFDVNFDEVLYLTDTGRRWDGDSFNIRDKYITNNVHLNKEEERGRKGEGEKGGVDNRDLETKRRRDPEMKRHPTITQSLNTSINIAPSNRRTVEPSYLFHSTFDIIKAANKGLLPDKIMMTFHPQRWTDKPLPWMKELVWQNVKNVGKYFLIKVRSE